jgi:hypothetical protein
MKALTLTQPWATLVILGVKRWETRSWKPRGIAPGDRIAIHAAKGWTRDDVDFAFDLAGRGLLLRTGAATPGELPRGAVLGTVVFTGYRPTAGMEPGDIEELLGDFTPGRFAWGLTLPREFARPVPARGALGLWEWTR